MHNKFCTLLLCDISLGCGGGGGTASHRIGCTVLYRSRCVRFLCCSMCSFINQCTLVCVGLLHTTRRRRSLLLFSVTTCGCWCCCVYVLCSIDLYDSLACVRVRSSGRVCRVCVRKSEHQRKSIIRAEFRDTSVTAPLALLWQLSSRTGAERPGTGSRGHLAAYHLRAYDSGIWRRRAAPVHLFIDIEMHK